MQRAFTLLLFCLVFLYAKADTKDLKKLILEVKEASYTDSVRFFQSGKEATQMANELKDNASLAEINIYYGNYFFYVRNFDKARRHFDRAITIASIGKSSHFELLARIRRAFLEIEMGNDRDGEKTLQALLTKAKKIDDKICIAELINLIGIVCEDHNKTKEAVNYYLEGLNFSELNNLEYYPGVFLNNLGLMKVYSGQEKDAMKDFQKALELAIKENNVRLANHARINVCLVLIHEKKYEEANKIFNEILRYSRKNKFPLELASTYINFGSMFVPDKKYEIALPYYDSAIVILENQHLNSELSRAYFGKAQLLTFMKKFVESDLYIEKAGKLAQMTGNLEDLTNYNYIKYNLFDEQKDYKNALDYYRKYTHIKDSAQNNLNNKVIQELQMQHAVQKKEIELAQERTKTLELEKKNQDERFWRWLSIGLSLFVLTTVFSLTYIIYSKRVRKAQENFSRQLIEVTDEERARIARDLHDELGQTLSIVKSRISRINSLSGEIEPIDNDISLAIEQTRTISRNLYPSVLEKVGLIRSVASILENVQKGTDIQCSYDIDESVESLPQIVKTHLYRIIQECINNTMKHAGASALKISILPDNDAFELIYLDNGKGLISKVKNGVGLQSIRERVKIINGEFSLDDKNHNGFKLVVKFDRL